MTKTSEKFNQNQKFNCKNIWVCIKSKKAEFQIYLNIQIIIKIQTNLLLEISKKLKKNFNQNKVYFKKVFKLESL